MIIFYFCDYLFLFQFERLQEKGLRRGMYHVHVPVKMISGPLTYKLVYFISSQANRKMATLEEATVCHSCSEQSVPITRVIQTKPSQ